MNKLFLISTALIIVVLFSGCRPKQWWEDCYASKEEALLDQLQTDLANIEDKHTEQIEECKSQLSDLEEELSNKTDELESRLSELEDKLESLQ
jgi:predicted transcriptional regulator